MYDDLETDVTPTHQPNIHRIDSSKKTPTEIINHDLFDDVLTPSPANNSQLLRQNSLNPYKRSNSNYSTSNSNANYPKTSTTHLKYSSSLSNSKKYHCYVGNLTWWTTDEEIETAIQSVGVTDLLEVEVQDFEHNGQSKGYCKVYTGSEASSKRIFAQLGKLTVNGRKPDVRNDRHGMDFFEKKVNPDYETKEEIAAKAQTLKMKARPIMPPVMLSKYDQSLTQTLNSPISMKNIPNMSSMPNLAGLPNMPGNMPGMPNLANMLNNLPNPLAGLPPPPGLSHSMGSLPPPPSFSSSKSINSILAKQSSSGNSNLSLRDFEKLVDNNREICSNAISKALDLADGKDYRMLGFQLGNLEIGPQIT